MVSKIHVKTDSYLILNILLDYAVKEPGPKLYVCIFSALNRIATVRWSLEVMQARQPHEQD